MKKIKAESCKTCCLPHEDKVKLGFPMVGVANYGLPVIIHSKCPLEDYENKR